MTVKDRLTAARQFLDVGFHPDDWIAVLLKPADPAEAMQRVGPVEWIASARFQAWLRAANRAAYNVYVSVNAVDPLQRSRRRQAICAVRHLFLDVDGDVDTTLAHIAVRPDLPSPSYVVSSSSYRAQMLWRVAGFKSATAEMLQKHLARELGTDRAATSCAQMARIPGFWNHKYRPAPVVTIQYRDTERDYGPGDFPDIPYVLSTPRTRRQALPSSDRAARARRYLAVLPPAVAGQHGDLQTFRLCCRLVRGFALTDADALQLLTEWNARCEPPWSERDLRDKLRHARQYGREPIGGLLEGRQ